MIVFTNILYNENLISSELRSTLAKPIEQMQSRKSKSDSFRGHSFVIKKSTNLVHYKNNSDFSQNEGQEILKNYRPSNEKNETYDKSSEDLRNSPNNNKGLQVPSSINEKMLSEYSGELSESFHDNKKIMKYSEYKILINETILTNKESKSYSIIKYEHSLSEKNQFGFGLTAKKNSNMNVSVALEETAKKNNERESPKKTYNNSWFIKR